jgi:hypothetical protein
VLENPVPDGSGKRVSGGQQRPACGQCRSSRHSWREACLAGGRRKKKLDVCREAAGEDLVEEEASFLAGEKSGLTGAQGEEERPAGGPEQRDSVQLDSGQESPASRRAQPRTLLWCPRALGQLPYREIGAPNGAAAADVPVGPGRAPPLPTGRAPRCLFGEP